MYFRYNMADYKKIVTKNMKLMYPHIPQQDMKTIVDCIFKLVTATDNAALAEPVKKMEPKQLTEGQKKKKNKEVDYRAGKKKEAAERKNGKPAGESPRKDAEELPKERQTPDRARQKQKTPAGYAETDEDGAYGEDAY